MGNSIEALSKEEIKDIDWDSLSSDSLYFSLNLDLLQSEPPRNLYNSACINSARSGIVWILTKKLIESFNEKNLPINIMLLLKLFFSFLYSEGIPYQFLFQDSSSKIEEVYNSSFHRLVPCLFYFKSHSKTVYVSVPQSSDYNKTIEQAHLLETIKVHFQEVNDYLISKNERIYLVDDNLKTVDIDNIYKHYTENPDEDSLKDPFKPQTKVFSIFKASIETAECDLTSPMSWFLNELVNKIIQLSPIKDIQKIGNAIELLLAMMSSQLYYMDKPIDRINYSCFKASPVVDLLMSLQKNACQQFSWKLLEVIKHHWKSQKPSPGFLSVFYNPNVREIREQECLCLFPKYALALIILLQNYSRPENPFLIQNWNIEWEEVTELLFENIENPQYLILFYNLLSNNPSFHAHLVSKSEPERFLEPMVKFIYTETTYSMKCNLILIIVLLLSKDKIFLKFINSSIQLQQISWLQNYRIESMSLGSCLFLGILRKFRENLRSTKNEYLYVISSSCFYNIADTSTNLHELVCMDFLSLIKAVFSKYTNLKNNEKPKEDIQGCIEILNLLIEILAKVLVFTYNSNPFLIYSILHQSELIENIKAANIVNKNIDIIKGVVDFFLPKINSDENIILVIMSYSKTFKINREIELQTFDEALNIEFFEEKVKWEECIIPFIWADAAKYLSLPHKERILLFKSDDDDL